MTVFASHIAADVLVRSGPSQRASRIAADILVSGGIAPRVSQLVAEILTSGGITPRASQVLAELLVRGGVTPRASQLLAEILVWSRRVTTPPIYPTLPGLGYSVIKRPTAFTTSQISGSGWQTVIGYAAAPIWEWDLTYPDWLPDTPGASDLKTFLGFWLACGGNLTGFLFDDPDDNTVTGQPIATGDGVTTNFPLVRTFGGASGTGTEPIGYLKTGATFNVYVAGTLLATSAYTVLTTSPVNQILKFGTAPANGAAITVDMGFYFYAQFKDASVELENLLYRIWAVKKNHDHVAARLDMRTASAALASFLGSRQPFWSAELFRFSLTNGQTLLLTSGDAPIRSGSTVWLPAGAGVPAITGGAWSVQNTIEVPQLEIEMLSTGADFNGQSLKLAVHNGAFDGCWVDLAQAIMPCAGAYGDTSLGITPIFSGRWGAAEITAMGVKAKIRGGNVLMMQYMPRNRFTAGCARALYSTGCGASRSGNTFAGTVASANAISLAWSADPASGGYANFALGYVTITSGAAIGTTRTIESVNSGGVALMYPMYAIPAAGDTFTATYGCDKTLATCAARFDNSQHYRGFDLVPPAEAAVVA